MDFSSLCELRINLCIYTCNACIFKRDTSLLFVMKRRHCEYVREIVMLTLELLFKGDFQFTEIFHWNFIWCKLCQLNLSLIWQCYRSEKTLSWTCNKLNCKHTEAPTLTIITLICDQVHIQGQSLKKKKIVSFFSYLR